MCSRWRASTSYHTAYFKHPSLNLGTTKRTRLCNSLSAPPFPGRTQDNRTKPTQKAKDTPHHPLAFAEATASREGETHTVEEERSEACCAVCRDEEEAAGSSSESS